MPFTSLSSFLPSKCKASLGFTFSRSSRASLQPLSQSLFYHTDNDGNNANQMASLGSQGFKKSILAKSSFAHKDWKYVHLADIAVLGIRSFWNV